MNDKSKDQILKDALSSSTRAISQKKELEISFGIDSLSGNSIPKISSSKKDLIVSSDLTITIVYPKLATFVTMNFQEGETPGMDQVFDMAAGCIVTISDAEQVYDCSDTPKKEILDFFDQMDTKQFTMIQNFFETMPKLQHKIKVTNPNTNVESEVVLEGLASFFA